MNSFTITGRLGQEPTFVATKEGNKELSVINIAVSTKKGQNPDWYNRIECWGKLSEVVQEYCHKGKEVLVSGYLALNEWNDKETGEACQKIAFKATRIQLLGSKKSGSKPAPKSKQETAPQSEYEAVGY